MGNNKEKLIFKIPYRCYVAEWNKSDFAYRETLVGPMIASKAWKPSDAEAFAHNKKTVLTIPTNSHNKKWLISF